MSLGPGSPWSFKGRVFPARPPSGAPGLLGLWQRRSVLWVHVHKVFFPEFLCPGVFSVMTLYIQDDIILRSLITSAKTPHPDKVTEDRKSRLSSRFSFLTRPHAHHPSDTRCVGGVFRAKSNSPQDQLGVPQCHSSLTLSAWIPQVKDSPTRPLSSDANHRFRPPPLL